MNKLERVIPDNCNHIKAKRETMGSGLKLFIVVAVSWLNDEIILRNDVLRYDPYDDGERKQFTEWFQETVILNKIWNRIETGNDDAIEWKL
jgi:hypothetical protein